MIKFPIDQDVLKVFRGRKLYGLQILDELNLEQSTKMRLGHLHSILDQLEKEELICSEWGEYLDESGGARRKYYQVTSRGLAELQLQSATTESLESL